MAGGPGLGCFGCELRGLDSCWDGGDIWWDADGIVVGCWGNGGGGCVIRGGKVGL